MNFALINLGCKVNRVESDAYASALLAQKNTPSSLEDADLIIINTCTVTAEAEKKTRKAVRRTLRINDHAHVVVTGCASAIDPVTYREMSTRICVWEKEELLARLACTFTTTTKEMLPVGEGFHSRVGVKVQDGCNNACTYCIVHVARGCARSYLCADVVAQCVSLAQAGVREIVLTGINLGSYCQFDPKDGSKIDLSGLLVRLLKATADIHAPYAPPVRFRLSSIEPRNVNKELIELVASSDGRICRHLHIPLQSGSSKVLSEMARPYDSEYFLDLVNLMRENIALLSLSTDIIVGFPGESDREFQETLDVSQACQFSKIHVFPYSVRAGTPAGARSDQLPHSVKVLRACRLRTLSDELRHADAAKREGISELALVQNCGTAMTESYFELSVAPDIPVGSLVPVVFDLHRIKDFAAK